MSPTTVNWRPGDELEVRGGRWTLVESTRFADCETLRLASSRAGAHVADRTLIYPFDRPRKAGRVRPIAVLRPRRWLRRVRVVKDDGFPVGGLDAAARSGIELLPYQLEPALAMIRHGHPRLLIADGVGLGKTIQAALVLSELARAQGAFRGLVVAPAGLRQQWSEELALHFSLAATVADAGWLQRLALELPADVNPWVLPGLYVTSADFIKRPEVLHSIESVDWDIVVVDEAHGASRGTARRAAVDAVAVRARRVLLLTATPHAGDPEQFVALCRIGEREPDGPPIVMYQRSRMDVGGTAERRTVMLPARLTDPERKMHRLLDGYATRVCQEAADRGDARARLAAIVLKKRSLSSAASLASSVRRRLALLAAGIVPVSESQPALPLEWEDPGDPVEEDDEPDEVLSAPGLADAGREQRWLAAIAESADTAATAESKTRVLLRFLRRIGRPALVFTEFRDTLERLYREIMAAGHVVRRLHGGLATGERLAAVREFNEQGGLLLATDAASEGLNLHHTCHIVFHYELPWSPARLEQRTGRVDRIGQRRTVHEILLVADDTAERLVLAPLQRRATLGRSAAPSLSRLADLLGESRVAAAIMDGGRVDQPRQSGASTAAPAARTITSSLRDEAVAEVDRLRMLRSRVSPERWHRASSSIPVTVLQAGHALSPGTYCVYMVTLSTRDGNIVHRSTICAADHDSSCRPAARAADVRRAVHVFLHDRESAVRSAALAARGEVLASAAALHRAALDRMEARERALAVPLPSAAHGLVQAGLFDRRAIALFDEQRRVSNALTEASTERVAWLVQARTLVTITQLAAVIIVSGTRR